MDGGKGLSQYFQNAVDLFKGCPITLFWIPTNIHDMKKKYRRCSDILLETSRKGKLTDLWLSTWLILKLILKLPGLTDLWSSTWLISVTGNLKKTFRGPSAEGKYLIDQNRVTPPQRTEVIIVAENFWWHHNFVW